MLGVDVPMLASSFYDEHRDGLVALLTVVGTIVVAIAVDRALLHRGHRLATAVVRDELTPVLDTRLRFLRRLITLSIVVIGLLLALAQFGGLSRLAAGLLASGALIAAILGFAARQTLANLIAGVMLTITQPLRIGDRVTVEQETGTVEDVRLNYTVVRGGDGGRIFIPNERLAAGILHNDTIVEPLVALEVELWLPAAVDADAALGALRSLDGDPVARIAQVGADGVRYTVARGTVPPGERPARESQLRADALRALRAARLLAAGPPA
ncbi:MAG TPA: mechanosensitive ion channel family protein [Conexibacter sp.]